MTNYGQLARRMASSVAGCFLSLHPVPTASAHSLAPASRARADSDPPARKSLGSIERAAGSAPFVLRPRSPPHVRRKVSGCRILEQIPAGSHALPLLPVWLKRGDRPFQSGAFHGSNTQILWLAFVTSQLSPSERACVRARREVKR